jgi:hypothetical protein
VDTNNGAVSLEIRWQVPNESPHRLTTSTSINANVP